jgi:hypothetical protein
MSITKDYLLNKLSRIKFLKTFLRKFGIANLDEQKQKLRVVFVNNKKPNDYFSNEPIVKYSKNIVKTSKVYLIQCVISFVFFLIILFFYFILKVYTI